MLKNPNVYNENDWQIQILKIFKLLNPKYIYVGEKIPLTSFVTGKAFIQISYLLTMMET